MCLGKLQELARVGWEGGRLGGHSGGALGEALLLNVRQLLLPRLLLVGPLPLLRARHGSMHCMVNIINMKTSSLIFFQITVSYVVKVARFFFNVKITLIQFFMLFTE
jgi:hypothetical protein